MSDRYSTIAINTDDPVPPPKKRNKPVSKQPDSPNKKTINNGKILFWGIFVCFLVVSYFLAGIYLAPLAIKKYLPQYVQNKTGLTLAIQDIQLNPINFQLTLKQVEANFLESAEPGTLLQAKSIFIDFDLTSLIRNTFVCDKLTIEGLQLNLIRYKNKSYNIPALSFLSKRHKQGDIIDFARLPFLFSLNNIDITESRIVFEDHVTEKIHKIEKLQLAIPTLSNFSFQSKKYLQPYFSAVINGSPIQLSGKTMQFADNQGYQTQLSCSIKSIDLVPYFSYLPSNFPLTLLKGKADTKLQISFAPHKTTGSRLNIDINMTATDVELQEKNNNFRISVAAMKVDAVYAPISRYLHFKNAIAKKLHLTGHKEHVSGVVQKLFSRLQKKDTGRNTIDIDLLLIDQGQITLSDETAKHAPKSQWDSLELTLKDYSSTQTSGTIHLSGKQTEQKGSFSWQGKFIESEKAQGQLLLNDFPAALLFKLLPSMSKTNINGIATFSGDLILIPHLKQSVRYAIQQGMLQLHDLTLAKGKDKWLIADSVRMTRLSRVNGRYDLGNIFVKNSTLTLNTSELPPLFSHLSVDKNGSRIKGMDFSGSMNLTTNPAQKSPLEISNIHFQVNNLDKPPSTDNFAFTGHLVKNGIIKAQGQLHFVPIRMRADTAFTDIDTSLLAPFFSAWPLLHNSKTTLHGKGVYRFPDASFQGNLRFTDTLIQNAPQRTLLAWNIAELKNITCNFSPFSLQAETLLLNAPKVHWSRKAISPFLQIQQGMYPLFQNSAKKNTLFPISIQKTTFLNGTVHFSDKRLSPHWKTTVTKLKGSINNLNTGATSLSSFTCSGITKNSPLALSGSMDFFHKNMDAKAGMTLKDFPLVALQRQLKSTSTNLKSAAFDLRLDLTESQKHSSGTGLITINNLTPKSKSSDTARALAFLQDEDNSFTMNIQMDSLNQCLLKEAVANFKTTVIKASYSPLLLDRKFQDLQDNNKVAFQPGTDTINASGKKLLIRYAELLRQHPKLRLVITGMADNKKDQAVLQKQLEAKQLQRINKENKIRLAEFRKKQQQSSTIEPSDDLQEEDIPKEDLTGYKPLLPKPVQVTKTSLLKLAQKRSLVVRNFLTKNLEVNKNRITIKKKGKLIQNAAPAGAQLTITTTKKTH